MRWHKINPAYKLRIENPKTEIRTSAAPPGRAVETNLEFAFEFDSSFGLNFFRISARVS